MSRVYVGLCVSREPGMILPQLNDNCLAHAVAFNNDSEFYYYHPVVFTTTETSAICSCAVNLSLQRKSGVISKQSALMGSCSQRILWLESSAMDGEGVKMVHNASDI